MRRRKGRGRVWGILGPGTGAAGEGDKAVGQQSGSGGLHGEAKPFRGIPSSRESGPGCVERALLVLLFH